MADRDTLFELARRNPAGLRFFEACRLAECFGWELSMRLWIHSLFKRPGATVLINLQNVRGMAKPYQVRQLVRAIKELEGL